MIQPISNEYDPYLTAASVAASTVTKVSDSDTEKKADSSQTLKTDTVEISAQARAAMQQANSVVSVGGKTTADSSENEQKAANATQAPAAKAPVATTTSASTTEQTNLTGLSQAEMDKLVAAGTITSGQEQAELTKRAAEKQQESVQDQKTQLNKSPTEIL